MKKILIIICIIITASTISCNKNYLNITPDGRTSLDDIFQDNDQTGAYLNSCYSNLQPYGLHYFFWTFLAGLTDDAHDNDAPTESLTATNWYKGSLTPVNNPLDGGGDWNRNYYGMAWQGIRRCNVFLANIDKANVTSSTDRATWKAEARVLRAYYYLELIKFYGGMPVETTVLPITSDFNTLKRGTFDDDVQQIVADCQAAVAEPNLPWRQTVEANRARMTKAVAYAIMSEATLYNASPLWNPNNDATKWQQAASISKDALAQLKGNGYQLANNYENYFITTPDLSSSPADKETIFQIKNSPGITQVQYLNGIPSVAAYKAGCTPSQELVDAYEMTNGQQPITGYSDADHLHPIINPASGYNDANPYANRDPRLYATVFYNGSLYGPINGTPHTVQAYVGGADGIAQNNRQYTHNGYYLKKFVDTTLYQGQGGNASWKRFRLAEIYLNYAEAENEANGPTQAAFDAVNTVRARVHMPLISGLSQSQLRDRIRNERRVEMAFEENRFWDVRRWKILSQSDVVSTGMQWTEGGANQRIVVDRRSTSADKFLIFPIPSSELASLPAFVQNPGW